MYGRDPYTFVNGSHIPSVVLGVITTILKSWDQASTDYEYITAFHQPHGTLHVAPEPAIGEAAMRKLHDDIIHPINGPVVALQHYLDRVFMMPGSPEGKTETVFTGKLTSVLKSGEEVTTDFATWIVASPNSAGELKVELLRVFSDTSELMKKIGDMMAVKS
ncbi:uncharacterized protein Z520_09713 [Fonsecaea multimorphosa CBS 102226]|uniref:SnoaL-like domain-containing protein n=1 Tax=Fonsecaea multimorphosa CBS 102226 TaxID=1442371 RepID=A0A0D2JMV5_9EURO|nr:uncharacterized protein Z520_09713 [Fonsecaea multimorphosa CBS 102226]KIX94667.1 hypothetical protein Z520_09713 [Fonsecaea multimorphosa CBS 102226]OAL20192.1 hypothetical protein AYO22_09086 [Fonsecaea multimorphosa]